LTKRIRVYGYGYEYKDLYCTRIRTWQVRTVRVRTLLDWSFNNKLTVNTSKIKEIVFRRSRFPNKLLPPLFPDIQPVDFIKLLGVYLSHTLSPDQHINHLLSQCNQRQYLLSQLKSQNLSAQ